MPPLLMTNIVRYALNGRWTNGRPIVNILDMDVRTNSLPDPGGFLPERDEAVEEAAERLATAWQEHLLPNLSSSYGFEGVSWVDLDSESGSTGSIVPVSDYPQVGALGADAEVPQTTLLVEKQLSGRRRGTRNGRWYISGVPEMRIDNNGIVLPIWVTQMDNALSDFLGDVSKEGTADHVWTVPVVVHESAAGANRITKLKTSAKVGKQGRRYDGRA